MPSVSYERTDLLKVIASRQDDGATIVAPGVARWETSRKCEAPVYREMTGRVPEGEVPRDGRAFKAKAVTARLTLEIEARCRKCQPCLRARATLWRLRAQSEIAWASRTWFGTLTVEPAQRFRLEMLCRRHLAANAIDFDGLPFEEQFRERVAFLNKEITRYVKRLRKSCDGVLRLILVHEAHKDGFPHVHLLVHEKYRQIGERTLRGQWKLGFSKFNLVKDGKPASYVTKYLTKSSLSRVRASRNYGDINTALAIAEGVKGSGNTLTSNPPVAQKTGG